MNPLHAQSLEEMIESRQTPPDRFGVVIPYQGIKSEFKNTFWLEFYRLRSLGLANLEDVPLLEADAVKANRRIMAGKPPLKKSRSWIRTVNHGK